MPPSLPHIGLNPRPPVGGKKTPRGMGGRSVSNVGTESSAATLDRVLSCLPTTPESQLDAGLEILRRAFSLRVSELEGENKEVKEDAKDLHSQTSVMEQKVAQLEKVISEMAQQTKDLAEEHEQLTSERDALASQYRKINHNTKALKAFKQNCEAFLEHKDDFDVDTVHDVLPPHLRELVETQTLSAPPSEQASQRASPQGSSPRGSPVRGSPQGSRGGKSTPGARTPDPPKMDFSPIDVFSEIDVDDSGRLSLDELAEALISRFGVSDAEVDEFFSLCDSNDDGELTMMEFSKGYKRYQKLKAASGN